MFCKTEWQVLFCVWLDSGTPWAFFSINMDGILARMRVMDPIFFLWTHECQEITFMRPTGRTSI